MLYPDLSIPYSIKLGNQCSTFELLNRITLYNYEFNTINLWFDANDFPNIKKLVKFLKIAKDVD